MKISILIISFSKHFPWLRHCLRSIEKYATGFHEVQIWVPNPDIGELNGMISGYAGPVPVRGVGYDDWPDRGFLKHVDLIMHADECCADADFVFGMDGDCIFIDHATPDDYFVDGKPVLMYGRYEWLGKIEPTILLWQKAAYNALGWTPEHEFMRRIPLVHPKETFVLTRQCIERHTGKMISDYVREQKNDFPQTIAEWPTIGAVAWRFLSDKYHWINQETEVRPKDKIFQGWSHQTDFNAPLEVWHNDQKVRVIPNEIFAKYL